MGNSLLPANDASGVLQTMWNMDCTAICFFEAFRKAGTKMACLAEVWGRDNVQSLCHQQRLITGLISGWPREYSMSNGDRPNAGPYHIIVLPS